MCHHGEYHYLEEWKRLREADLEEESDEPAADRSETEPKREDEEREDPRHWIPGAADD